MRLISVILAFAALLGIGYTHPHVLVDVKVKIHINNMNEATHLSHEWVFDESFTAFAIQGLDKNKDGQYSREELQPLAKVNVTSLQEYHYFTFVSELKSGKYEDKNIDVTYSEPYYLTYDNGRLTLHYDAVLKTPVSLKSGTIAFDIYDPDYFVAMTLTKDAVSLQQGQSSKCSFDVSEPPKIDPKVSNELAKLPSDMREIPDEFADITSQLANRIMVKCS